MHFHLNLLIFALLVGELALNITKYILNKNKTQNYKYLNQIFILSKAFKKRMIFPTSLLQFYIKYPFLFCMSYYKCQKHVNMSVQKAQSVRHIVSPITFASPLFLPTSNFPFCKPSAQVFPK